MSCWNHALAVPIAVDSIGKSDDLAHKIVDGSLLWTQVLVLVGCVIQIAVSFQAVNLLIGQPSKGVKPEESLNIIVAQTFVHLVDVECHLGLISQHTAFLRAAQLLAQQGVFPVGTLQIEQLRETLLFQFPSGMLTILTGHTGIDVVAEQEVGIQQVAQCPQDTLATIGFTDATAHHQPTLPGVMGLHGLACPE